MDIWERTMIGFIPPNISLVLHIALAMLVYHDQRLNGRSGIGWAAFIFFTGLYGFIFYIFFNLDSLKLAAQRFQKKNLIEKISSPIYDERKKIEEMKSQGGMPSFTPDVSFIIQQFQDRDLDELIREGNIAAARKHLDGILKISEETGDFNTMEKYEWYSRKISAMENTEGDHLIDL